MKKQLLKYVSFRVWQHHLKSTRVLQQGDERFPTLFNLGLVKVKWNSREDRIVSKVVVVELVVAEETILPRFVGKMLSLFCYIALLSTCSFWRTK